eukprot:CAMPEP_0185281420 /NCGR_PEP_ID=MMETSP1359-20130426/66708_1 /TAXON_ID=552665 /ORGANISM="Bigelowiella longifila, Strain CCMP242" /LENGTH=308 /DNA_ID=CAMNT_0027876849 /DNA_START=11 /DNA_END=937 /DNA_ORIENTATION=+
MEVEFTGVKPLAPIVVVGTPDVSLAGVRLLLAASKPHSRIEWPVHFRKSTVDEKLSNKTSIEAPVYPPSVVFEDGGADDGSSPAKVVQLNFGDNKNNPALTFLAVNVVIPPKKSTSLANSFLTILRNDKKVKSLILLNPLRVDPTLPHKSRIPEGNVQCAVWNKYKEPKGINIVDTHIRNFDPFLCALAHFSLVLEIPTLSINTRGYRYQPVSAVGSNKNPKYDGTEDVALNLWKALKEILSESLQSINKAGNLKEEEIIDAATPDIKKFRSLKISKKSIALSQPILGTYSAIGDGEKVVDNRNVLYA